MEGEQTQQGFDFKMEDVSIDVPSNTSKMYLVAPAIWKGKLLIDCSKPELIQCIDFLRREVLRLKTKEFHVKK